MALLGSLQLYLMYHASVPQITVSVRQIQKNQALGRFQSLSKVAKFSSDSEIN